MTALIAGFTEGLFQGMDWREARDDRARKRKIEEEMLGRDRQRFEWEKGDQAYGQETRQNAREDRKLEESERKRAMDRRSAEEAAWNATVDQLMGRGGQSAAPSAPAPQSQAAPAEVRVPASIVPQAQRSGRPLTYGLGVLGGGAGTDAMSGGPGQDMIAQPNAGQVLAGSADSFLNGIQSGNGPGVVQSQAAPSPQGQVATDAAGRPVMVLPPRVEDQVPAPRRAPPAMGIAGLVNPDHQYGQPGGLIGDAGQLAARAITATNELPGKVIGGAANVVNRAVNPIARYATGMEFPLVPGAPFGPDQASPAPAPAEMPGQGQAAARTSSDRAPAVAAPQLSYGAPPTQDGTPMVSLSLGQEMGVIGPGAPVSTTPAITDKTASQFVSAYQAEKMPAIVEHYLRNGEVEKAKAFEDWMQDRQVKAGMKAWAKAGHALSVGDGEKFMDHLAEAYNVRGYADDGYSVDRGKSRLIYGDNGDLLGAQITFIDEATGKEFVQNFEGINDLMAVGWGMLAPEQQFEMGWSATMGAKKQAPAKIDPAKVMDAIEARRLSDPEFAALPSAEKERIMLEAFQRISGGSVVPSDDDIPVDTLD